METLQMPSLFSMGSSGVRLAVDVESQDKLPTVLFLHAGGENRKVWRPITPAIQALGWRTVTVDLRGHGDSARAPDYRLEDFLDDVVSVLAEFCGQPVVIVGGSIGGILGTLVAGEKRASVNGIVLLDTATRMPKVEGPQAEIRKIVSAKARGVEAVASVDPKFLDGTFLADLNRDPDRLSQAARQLDIPVMFIGGEFSRYRAEATEVALREDIPHVEIEYVPGGHLVARDCPADVNRLLAKFILSLRPSNAAV